MKGINIDEVDHKEIWPIRKRIALGFIQAFWMFAMVAALGLRIDGEFYCGPFIFTVFMIVCGELIYSDLWRLYKRDYCLKMIENEINKIKKDADKNQEFIDGV